MAIALVVEPTSAERESAVAVVQTAGRRPAPGFRHPHQIVTDIWVRREAAWRAPVAGDRS
jgi:hypothetical protein